MPKCLYFRDRFLARAKDCLTDHTFKNAVNIKATVFSRGVPITNQFQVLFTRCTFLFKLPCIHICFQVVFTFVFKLYCQGSHLFLSCIDKVTICFHTLLFTSCRVLPSSCISTFGNDVVHHNSPQKRGRKTYYILLTHQQVNTCEQGDVTSKQDVRACEQAHTELPVASDSPVIATACNPASDVRVETKPSLSSFPQPLRYAAVFAKLHCECNHVCPKRSNC